MDFKDLPILVQRNVNAGFPLMRHTHDGNVPHVATAKLWVVMTTDLRRDGQPLMLHFCHDESCYDIFPEYEFEELPVEGAPPAVGAAKRPKSALGNGVAFDPAVHSVDLADALQRTADAAVHAHESFVKSALELLVETLSGLYRAAVAAEDQFHQRVWTHLLYAASFAERPTENTAGYEQFCRMLEDEGPGVPGAGAGN